jgi:hypothetical protein
MAQIGPDYTYNNDTTIAPATLRKIAIIARKDPEGAALVAAVLGVGDSIPGLNINGNASQILNSFDARRRNMLLTQFSQELAIAGAQAGTGGAGGPGPDSSYSFSIFGNAAQSVNNYLDEVSLTTGVYLGAASTSITNGLKDLMKPVSPFIGTTLGTLSQIAKDPLGSLTRLPDYMLRIVESISPAAAATIEKFFKSEKVSNLARLPSLVFGSIRSVIQAVDYALALPAMLLSDLYNLVSDIMEGVADLIDNVLNQVINFIYESLFGWLDDIFPLTEILALLGELNILLGEIGGITTALFGTNFVSGFTFSLQGYITNIKSALTSPMTLINTYLPNQVRDVLFTLRNPAQLVNSIIPPEIGNFLGKIQQVTGIGLNGNMGYSFLGVLEAFKGGIVGNIVRNFSNQYRILTPLLGITSGSGSSLVAPGSIPAYLNAITNSLVTHGIIQPQSIPPAILAPVPRAIPVTP